MESEASPAQEPTPEPRVWKDLTSAQIKVLWNVTKKPSEFASMLIAKFKEINS